MYENQQVVTKNNLFCLSNQNCFIKLLKQKNYKLTFIKTCTLVYLFGIPKKLKLFSSLFKKFVVFSNFSITTNLGNYLIKTYRIKKCGFICFYKLQLIEFKSYL